VTRKTVLCVLTMYLSHLLYYIIYTLYKPYLFLYIKY
jgi:hypothetical protein